MKFRKFTEMDRNYYPGAEGDPLISVAEGNESATVVIDDNGIFVELYSGKESLTTAGVDCYFRQCGWTARNVMRKFKTMSLNDVTEEWLLSFNFAHTGSY